MRNSFFAFVRKEIVHILRDPRTMLIAVLIPVVQMILFGFAISTEVNNIDVMVAAPKINQAVAAKVAQLSHNPYVTFKGYIAADEVDKQLAANHALAVVVFDNDYGICDKSQIVVDASNTTTAQTAAGYLTQMLSDSDNATHTPGNHYSIQPPVEKRI